MDSFFFGLLIVGTLMLGAEVFLPGGVLGVLGGMALIGAMVLSFQVYPDYAWLICAGILLLAIFSFFAWIKIFPSTGFGKRMSLSTSMAGASSTEAGLTELRDATGEALTDCMPSGYARFAQQRVDVVTSGEVIQKGSKVRVIEVEGNRVIIKAVKDS